MSIVLACDLGGGGFRAALIDETGAFRAERAVAGAGPREISGMAEFNPEDWWTALLDAGRALHRDAPDQFARVEGIAICGVTRTQVFLDRAGRSLRRAIAWNDARASDGVAALLALLPRQHPERVHINAFHPLARLDWLRREEETVFRDCATVLDPKDYLNFRLTGARASDPVSMARLLAAAAPAPDGRSLLAAIGAPATLTPTMREPLDVVGPVAAGLPAPLDKLAGKPVFCCANDTWAAVVGLGAMRPGAAYNISGTTEVLGVLGAEPLAAEGLMSVDWRGLHQLGGPGQNGADTLRWLLSALGADPRAAGVGEATATLLAQPRDPQPVLFLPYLQGERVPYWDPSLRGAFLGLNRRHGAADLAFAVLEGVAFLNRVVLERAEAALGRPVDEIRFGGGAAANPLWRQIKADVCERPVVSGAAAEPGLLGAAIVAFAGLGRFASLIEAQDRLVRIAHRHAPDPARGARYRDLYALFRRSELALAPISRELAALADGGSPPARKG